jgi:cysteinyl-tRNA synthetase
MVVSFELVSKIRTRSNGCIAALSEEERALMTSENTNKEKKNEWDFVLWGKSKQGEPVCQSLWELG